MQRSDPKQVEAIFHAALDLPPQDRTAYLREACSGNDILYAEVESLISALENGDSVFEESGFQLGMEILSNSSAESMAGKTVGAYNVLSRLGKGGMGEVYLAEDKRLERKVALKFLSSELMGDNWAKRQLVKEAQAVAMLDHVNICPVYGIEEDGDHIFIVMKYVEGETVADLVRARALPVNEALPIAQQIVSALAEAHAHGIIHRDIKPGNIMVTKNGQVKVLDFGLAKTIQQKHGLAGAADSTSHLSQTGAVAGTVSYMSPEQLRGERLDYRSDVFSLGVVFYEMLSGKNPYARQSTAETISAILAAPIPRLVDTSREIPRELDQIVLKCLEKDRDRRYQSASELLTELVQLQEKARQDVPRSRTISLRTAAVIAIVAVTLLVAVFWLRAQLQSRTVLPGANNVAQTARQPRLSLAVLPIANLTQDNTLDYLGDGLTDSLISKFSDSGVTVLPYTTIAGYKNDSLDPQTVGRELNAGAVLTGKIIRQGNSVLLQTKLLKTADGSPLWEGNDEIKLSAIFELEDRLAASVTNSLPFERRFIASRGTASQAAFREYMLGKYFWRHRDEKNIKKAIGHFDEAIRLDPVYAQAHAGLADCYVLLSTVAFGKMPTAEAMAKATAAAKEALAIDDRLPEAHTSLGVVSLRFDWDWQAAEKSFLRAIELKPDYAAAHYWYSQLLLVTGKPQQAVTESEKAKTLDPFSGPAEMNYCRTLSLARQYSDAIKCYDDLLQENPNFDHAKYLRALVQHRTGQYNQALSAFETLYSRNRPLAGAVLGYAYGRAGRIPEAQRVLTEMQVLSTERFVPPIEFAIIYVGMGDKDSAFTWLEEAYNKRFATLIYITVDPIFASLHSDPRFVSLVQRMKLPMPSQV